MATFDWDVYVWLYWIPKLLNAVISINSLVNFILWIILKYRTYILIENLWRQCNVLDVLVCAQGHMFNAFQYINTASELKLKLESWFGWSFFFISLKCVRLKFSKSWNIFLSLSVPDRFQVFDYQTSQLYKSQAFYVNKYQ